MLTPIICWVDNIPTKLIVIDFFTFKSFAEFFGRWKHHSSMTRSPCVMPSSPAVTVMLLLDRYMVPTSYPRHCPPWPLWHRWLWSYQWCWVHHWHWRHRQLLWCYRFHPWCGGCHGLDNSRFSCHLHWELLSVDVNPPERELRLRFFVTVRAWARETVGGSLCWVKDQLMLCRYRCIGYWSWSP